MKRFLFCRRYRRWIFADLDQELDLERKIRLQRHLQSCADCQGFRLFAEKEHQLLYQAFAEAPSLPGSLAESVLEKINAPSPRISSPQGKKPLLLGIASLLGILILCRAVQNNLPSPPLLKEQVVRVGTPSPPTISFPPPSSQKTVSPTHSSVSTQKVKALEVNQSPSQKVPKGGKKTSPQRVAPPPFLQSKSRPLSTQKQEALREQPLVKTDDHQRFALSLGEGLQVRLNVHSEMTPVRAPQPEDPYWEIRLVKGEIWFRNLDPQQGLRILTPVGEAVIPPGEVSEASILVDRDNLSEMNLIVVQGKASFQSPQGVAVVPEMSSLTARVGETPEVARFFPEASEKVQWAYEPVQQNLILR